MVASRVPPAMPVEMPQLRRHGARCRPCAATSRGRRCWSASGARPMATRFASGLCVACPVGTDMAHSRSNLWLEAPRHRRRRRNCQSELLGRKLPGHGLLNSLELRGGVLIAANSPPPRARSARRQQRTLWASLLLPTTPGCAARRCGLPAALTGGTQRCPRLPRLRAATAIGQCHCCLRRSAATETAESSEVAVASPLAAWP